MTPRPEARLIACLEEAQSAGYLGPAPVGTHYEHALAHLEIVRRCAASELCDLGTGGGLPGLVLAVHLPEVRVTMVEAMHRRALLLRHAIERLRLPNTVVYDGRAEALARSALRESFDVVTARAFAPPAVTAEIGAALLCSGGSLVVSDSPARTPWPADQLGVLGLREAVPVTEAGYGFVIARKDRPAEAKFPRRAPAKRPLW